MTIAHLGGHGRTHLSEYAGDVWFGRLDARAKVVGIFGLVIVSAVLTDFGLVLASLAVALTLVFASRLPILYLARLYLTALPFILFASVSVFLFGGWERGIEMWARTSACVLPLLVLAAGTETFDLFAGLRRLHVPAVITTLLMLTQRYILLLSEELSRMSIARKARGFGGARNLLDRYGLKVLSFTAGMVLVRSFDRADDIYEGLKCKGFRQEMTPWRRSQVALEDVLLASGLAAIAGALLVLQLRVIA
jgi:cobalt/nickel transport system permease protein